VTPASQGAVYGKVPSQRGAGPNRPKPPKPGNKHRSPLWTKLLMAFGALVLIGSGTFFAIFEAGLTALNNSVPQANLFGGTQPLSGNAIKGPINMLMVGLDASGVHTDSIIIAHIPATHDRVYLISLPRDTKVNVLGGGTNKINSTYSGKSPFANLANTIQSNYGLTFNGGVIINFNGFSSIVTKLGGIDMYVDETTHSIHHGWVGDNKKDLANPPSKINSQTGVPECSNPHYSFDTNADACTIPGDHEVTYPKGPYHFDAYDALDFVRCRDGLVGTDYARQRHQQQFIKAVMDKVYAKGLSDPTKLLGLVNSLSKAFSFDKRGVSLSNWIFTLKSITPSSLYMLKTNDGKFVSPPGPSDGHGSEQWLNDDSIALLNDARDDNGSADPIATFIETHPDWIANT
jgi:LCP family protein required for cell wall assembly